MVGGIQVYDSYQQDGGRFGYHAQKATAGFGGAIGVWFRGVAGIGGSTVGSNSVDYYYNKQMKKLELRLNIVHYCIYSIHYKLHLLANKVNPFNLIHGLPFQKRRDAELGIDIQKQIDKAFSDKRNGISMTIAGGMLLEYCFFWLWGLFI